MLAAKGNFNFALCKFIGGFAMALSESKAKSNKKFDDKTYKYCSIKFRIEEYERLKQYCKSHNISFNGFVREIVIDAINEEKNN